MKHSIREHIIDPVRGKIVKVSTVNAELGSGITDKNGREIFEGDTIQTSKGFFEIMIMVGGEFCAVQRSPNIAVALREIPTDELEVVGHVDD